MSDDELVKHMTGLIAAGLDRVEQLTAERDAAYARGYADAETEISKSALGQKNDFLHSQYANAADYIKVLTTERERLALAICGGEDAPGYANAQTVETLEHVAKQNQQSHGATINSLLAAEAERDRLQGEVKDLKKLVYAAYCDGFNDGKDGGWIVGPSNQPWKASDAHRMLKTMEAKP